MIFVADLTLDPIQNSSAGDVFLANSAQVYLGCCLGVLSYLPHLTIFDWPKYVRRMPYLAECGRVFECAKYCQVGYP